MYFFIYSPAEFDDWLHYKKGKNYYTYMQTHHR